MNRDYEVVTVHGIPIRTFPERADAISFASANQERFPGIRVNEITRSETRKPIWSSRHQLVRSGR